MREKRKQAKAQVREAMFHHCLACGNTIRWRVTTEGEKAQRGTFSGKIQAPPLWSTFISIRQGGFASTRFWKTKVTSKRLWPAHLFKKKQLQSHRELSRPAQGHSKSSVLSEPQRNLRAPRLCVVLNLRTGDSWRKGGDEFWHLSPANPFFLSFKLSGGSIVQYPGSNLGCGSVLARRPGVGLEEETKITGKCIPLCISVYPQDH